MLVDRLEIIKIVNDWDESGISDDAIELTLREQSSIFWDSLYALK